MVGGAGAAVDAPGTDLRHAGARLRAAQRTPAAPVGDRHAEHGWLHCGPTGAGHFVKMVHNGIEYGLMAAYAEGLNVLAKPMSAARSTATPRPLP